MSGALLGLLDRDRPATVFLPPATFGVLYSNYNTWGVCHLPPRYVLPLDFPQWYLLLAAIVSSITAAISFARRHDIAKSQSSEDYSLPWYISTVTFLSPIFLLASFIELLFRLCNSETLIILLFLAHCVLLVMSLFE